MTKRLFFQAIFKFLCGVILIGLLLFFSAGTPAYPNAWLFIGLLFIPMLFLGVFLMLKNPDLLKKRLNSKETESEQNLVVKLSGLMFLIGFVLAGLDFRFAWLPLPKIIPIIASVVFFSAYILYAEVMRENTYLSRTVEVQEGQRVIDKGLYGIVRHPMYSATILLFLSLPLVLGSLIAFLVFLPYPFILAKRIKNEEKLLTDQLEGYAEYKKKVKYRLIPFIW